MQYERVYIPGTGNGGGKTPGGTEQELMFEHLLMQPIKCLKIIIKELLAQSLRKFKLYLLLHIFVKTGMELEY